LLGSSCADENADRFDAVESMTNMGKATDPLIVVAKSAHSLTRQPIRNRHSATSCLQRNSFDKIETRESSETPICGSSTRIHERRELIWDGDHGPIEQTQGSSIRQAKQADVENTATKTRESRTQS
jgi:hypothetical protein